MMTPERFAKIQRVLSQRQHDLTLVLDKVHKTWNLSALVRTCDAVGILKVYAQMAKHIEKINSKHASGSDRWVKVTMVQQLDETISSLKDQGYQILGADIERESVDYRSVDYCQPTALVMGAEKFGLSPETRPLLDKTVTIPNHGFCESLNVSVATALITYEAERQRSQAGYYQDRRMPQELYRTTLFEWSYPLVAHFCQVMELNYPSLGETGAIAQGVLPYSVQEIRRIVRQRVPHQEYRKAHLEYCQKNRFHLLESED